MTGARRARRIVAAVACAALLIAFVSVLGQERRHIVGTNSVPARDLVATITAGQTACQKERVLPAGTRSLTLGANTMGAPGPELVLTVTAGGRQVARGRVAGNYPDSGVVGINMDPVDRTYEHVVVCVRDLGPASLNLYGEPTTLGTPLTAGGVRKEAVATVIWYGHTQSWASLVPTIAHHADTGGTELFGALTLWLALAFVLLAGAGALFVTLREADR